jgi:acetyl-CoA C-acetyltransferase
VYVSNEIRKHITYTDLILSTAWADAGVNPIDFPEAPTKALPIALQKANLTIADISLFELNEAFSVVVRIAEKVCNIDSAKINVNGYVFVLSV